MQFLADTGILLRLFDSIAPEHPEITTAVRRIWAKGHTLVTTSQNISEFWNVSTRPHTARGGFGQPVAVVSNRFKAIERFCEILPFSDAAYVEWRRLVVTH
jgi:predicted nucleic acid-binding protein